MSSSHRSSEEAHKTLVTSQKRPVEDSEPAVFASTKDHKQTAASSQPRQTLSRTASKRSLCVEAEVSKSESGSETEKERFGMSAKLSKHRSSSSPGNQTASRMSRSKTSDDWAGVTEPEERRRIQNRIAQRKFREKAREQRERAERDARNQQHAGSAYRVPAPEELAPPAGAEEGGLSGLPWGGVNLQHMIARGHDAASSQRSSQRDSRRASEGLVADDAAQQRQQQHYISPPPVYPPGAGPLGYGHAGDGYDGHDDVGDDGSYDTQPPHHVPYGYGYGSPDEPPTR